VILYQHPPPPTAANTPNGVDNSLENGEVDGNPCGTKPGNGIYDLKIFFHGANKIIGLAGVS